MEGNAFPAQVMILCSSEEAPIVVTHTLPWRLRLIGDDLGLDGLSSAPTKVMVLE